MGVGPMSSGCYTNGDATSPNPSPERHKILKIYQCEHGHVVKVEYLDCTNFEGVKILVYRGQYEYKEFRDPHFSDDPDPDSPVARFKPDSMGEGWSLAVWLCEYLES